MRHCKIHELSALHGAQEFTVSTASMQAKWKHTVCATVFSFDLFRLDDSDYVLIPINEVFFPIQFELGATVPWNDNSIANLRGHWQGLSFFDNAAGANCQYRGLVHLLLGGIWQ